ncbi:DUF3617 domain-containing protein [Sphingomonas sp. GB1N7]|uniref:DUF3617 domain-containing protein n=1 Tax=Parasphingomonas caseinilytica TaxID=3096158 RepID=UPI002FCA4541
MRNLIALTGVALLAAGCGKSDSGPVKRQPGSWSQKIEIVEFAGPGIKPEQKAQMQQMMNMMAGVSACITPEFAAQEDAEKNLTAMGGAQNNCKVTDKNISGGKVAFTANCSKDGRAVKLTADGTSSATEQNIKMSVESAGTNNDGGKLVMNVSAKREGECKPGEFTPPVPKPVATPAAKS